LRDWLLVSVSFLTVDLSGLTGSVLKGANDAFCVKKMERLPFWTCDILTPFVSLLSRSTDRKGTGFLEAWIVESSESPERECSP